MVAMAAQFSYRVVAAHFGCSASTVARQVTTFRQTGTTSSPKRPGHSHLASQRVLSRIKRIASQHRSATWQELISEIRQAGIPIGRTSVRKVVRDQLGFPRSNANRN